CHRLYDNGTEPASLRRGHAWTVALSPAHDEGVVVGAPRDIQATRNDGERPVFPGIGGEFVQGEPEGLRGSHPQVQLWAVHGYTRTNEVCERRELSTNQVLDLDPIPRVPHEQVLIG